MHRQLAFSKQQLQQLRGTYRSLRRLNRAVVVHLLKIHTHSRDKRYADAGKLLAAHASRMDSLLRFWQEIVDSASSQGPAPMFLDPYVCESCTQTGTRVLPESRMASLPEAFTPDPGWRSEIDWVLQAMRRTEERVFTRYLLRGTRAGTFFSAANRLRKVLLQEKLHFLNFTPEPMKPVDPVQDETCAGCGTPAGNDRHADDWRQTQSLRAALTRLEDCAARKRTPEETQDLAARLQRAELRDQKGKNLEGDR
jgi:hypothetical protein